MGDPLQNVLNSVPLVGNFMVSPEFQQARQAVDSFIEGQLRLASGAAVPETEVQRYRQLYTPRPGDKGETIRQKLGALASKVRQAQGLAGQPQTATAPNIGGGPAGGWTDADERELAELERMAAGR